ncbi:MAG TPA: Asp-tRNA(Asn)/Glu-tRNA(Gln) amidotransferase subunit GatA [Candidatus Pacearchaeota archaeon]|nr:Asp-tRNA(Asn)/Glu-tRNA(Gln) amidotransferase subunit GatA [Candidatus Pacearchaeota archaeon]HOK94109.1 Asp-tRNA(Asn)/Glu-tRNA(Gln) amidotransferase subunit GatA [Candidatus Pacearchaeota archaeon]HPO75237.1 Asp-tRNA(Asn)/Glu-tRNA(Gln) amidotransferase subunit GatA [Candidatus Pacearchaeota archaeon]
MTITELHQKFIKKELSPVEMVKDYFKKIKKDDREIHAFLTLMEDEAFLEAKEAEKKFLKAKSKNDIEKIPLLCGIPCAVKDNILIEDVRCTAGSKILEDYIAPYSATVIEKLKNLGVVFLGKTNLDEFAMGASTETSAYGVTHNPIDKTRVPGGSSGGSAAAVAADFCQFALGSDTGGSIRQPASFCGVVGLKPTYGAVSRYGLIAMASSLDQIGPITKNVEDAEIVFKAIKGKDSYDSTSVESEFPIAEPYEAERGVKRSKASLDSTFQFSKLRIGIPKEYFIKGIEKDVKENIEKAIEKFQKLGAKIESISLPHTKYALATYYLIMPSEVSSNLARYDGIRYGLSKSKISKLTPKNSFEIYSKIRGKYLGAEAKRRILLGTFALSAGYYDQYYLKARMVRELIKKDFEIAFQKVDLILTPVSPTTAFKIGENINDPVKMYLSDIFTVGVSLVGLPALSLPCGNSKEGLPIGLQIIGKPFKENIILKTAKTFDEFYS